VPFKTEEKVVRYAFDASKLTDEELQWAQRIAAKATTPVLLDAEEAEDIPA
jgi:hypothetical protein